MSVEAMKLALEALDCLIYDKPYAGRFADALIGLRTAIQQAEAQQVEKSTATGESVKLHKECATMPNYERCDECRQKTSEPVVDLDLLDWGCIKEAAATSEWIPAEYFQNDWVADVCEFLRSHPAPSVPDDVVRDAERGRFLIEWLRRYGLLQSEFGQMGVGEKPENWWLLQAPWGIDKTRPFFGHGKTPEQAIDAAMLADKEK